MRDSQFYESLWMNNQTYSYYYDRLVNLAVSRFEWVNLPDTVDVRFLELSLCFNGAAIFVNDEVLGLHGLRMLPRGPFDVYGYPYLRTAYGYNGVNIYCTEQDSVLVYNNMLRKPIYYDLKMFAQRLYNYDRVADINVNSQKTPVLLLCDESERLTARNVYMKYDGNEPVIMGNKKFNPDAFRVLKTDAPFTADKINELKNKVWNEAMSYLGIYNIEYKASTVTELEVQRSQGGTIASRFSPLVMRQKACQLANEMWGLDLDCRYRDPNEFADPFNDEGIAGLPQQGERGDDRYSSLPQQAGRDNDVSSGGEAV